MKRELHKKLPMGSDSLGIYIREIARFPLLDPSEEKTVAERARDGDRAAFKTLIESNLRFVVSMARKYARSGYPIHELINEGNLGLIEAARRFDPDRDVRFITYASWWIRQAILAAIARYGQVFSVPPKLKHALYRFESRVGRLTQQLGHRPSVEEISEEFSMREEDVLGMMGRVPSEVSLSAPLGDEGDVRVEDLIADPSIAPADKALIARSFQRALSDLLAQLDARERLVVERRFGFSDQEPLTLAELGERLDLSRERVRQIEERALGKLRRSQRVHQLMGCLN